MPDTVTKELRTIISAEDQTQSTWDAVKGGIESVKEWMTPLNQAWELSAKVWGKIEGAATAAIDAMTRGGELNETATAFERLSEKTNLGGDSMVAALKDITDGVTGISDAMKLADEAMNRGFSAAQFEAIAKFAKKLEEATGESMTATIDSIERAILTGQRVERLEMFGIHIEKGQNMTEVIKELDKATASFGDGAFNFGDMWAGAWQGVSDAVDLVAMNLNRLAGKDGGVKTFSDSFNDAVASVQANAPLIAAALWEPINSIMEWVESIGGAVIGAGKITVDVIGEVGNTIYDLMKLAAAGSGWLANMASGAVAVKADMLAMFGDEEGAASARKKLETLQGIMDWRMNLNDSQEKFNAAIEAMQNLEIKATEITNDHADAAGELAKGLDAVADTSNKASSAIKGTSDELKKTETDFERISRRAKEFGWEYSVSKGGVATWTPGTPAPDGKSTDGGGGAGWGSPTSAIPTGGKSDGGGGGKGWDLNLKPPPGDPLLKLIVDYLNQAIQAEGTVGAGF